MWVRFTGIDPNLAAGISIEFTDPASYFIGFCVESTFTLPGTDKYRIWTFKKQDDTLQLLCNGVEIFNFNYEKESPRGECRDKWSSDFSKMMFPSNYDLVDNASDLYRQHVEGKYRLVHMKGRGLY